MPFADLNILEQSSMHPLSTTTDVPFEKQETLKENPKSTSEQSKTKQKGGNG
jgi:hypothetical protein